MIFNKLDNFEKYYRLYKMFGPIQLDENFTLKDKVFAERLLQDEAFINDYQNIKELYLASFNNLLIEQKLKYKKICELMLIVALGTNIQKYKDIEKCLYNLFSALPETYGNQCFYFNKLMLNKSFFKDAVFELFRKCNPVFLNKERKETNIQKEIHEMNKYIIKLYPSTKDAVLVDKHLGNLITLKDYVLLKNNESACKDLLSECKKLEEK